MKYLSPELEIVLVGLAESWRRGLPVVMRKSPLEIISCLFGSTLQHLPVFPQAVPHSLNFFRPKRNPAGRMYLPNERMAAVSSSNFSIRIRQEGSVALLDVSGRLTSFETVALREAVAQLLIQKRKQIVLNLSGLQYIDSTGIGELARNYVSVVKQGGQMKVVGLSSKVEEVLKITQLYQVFPEFPSEEEAVNSFRNSAGART